MFIIILIQLLCFIRSMYSQNDVDSTTLVKNKFRYVSFISHSGGHLYSGEALNKESIEFGYVSGEVRVGWQPSDENHWSNQYGYASYGLGFYSGTIGDPEIFGNPNAIFAFADFPLRSSSRKMGLNISPAMGLTYNLKPYSKEGNPTNDAIGSSMTVYFNLSTGISFKLTRELDLLLGLEFTHFSNGRTYTPNYGLNMYGTNIGLKYYYNRSQKKVDKDRYTTNVLPVRFKRPKKQINTKLNQNRVSLYSAIGTVQNRSDQGSDNRYVTSSTVLDYTFQFDNMHGITSGVDLFYDKSLREYTNKGLTGIHIGCDFSVWRFTTKIQIGTYLFDAKGKGKVYLRPAVMYQISDKCFAQLGLKTKKIGAADWIELGVGYNIWQK